MIPPNSFGVAPGQGPPPVGNALMPPTGASGLGTPPVHPSVAAAQAAGYTLIPVDFNPFQQAQTNGTPRPQGNSGNG